MNLKQTLALRWPAGPAIPPIAIHYPLAIEIDTDEPINTLPPGHFPPMWCGAALCTSVNHRRQQEQEQEQDQELEQELLVAH